MRHGVLGLAVAALVAAGAGPVLAGPGKSGIERDRGHSVQLGPRPFYLVDKMSEGDLKDELTSCEKGPFKKTDFSIGHRGAPLQFPEHTKESYEAAARQGAGILECDVSFTNDGQLVCRHAQCDLHTTTNILATGLAGRCTTPFAPAEVDAEGNRVSAASARCCTSDISLAQFKTLEGKMDASDRNATTVEEFLGGTANWRSDLYATGATLLSHKESIELFKSLDVKFTPELKGPDRGANLQVEEVFGSQAGYASAMIQDYIDAGVDPRDVWAQSFNLADVLHWIDSHPDFGRQAVFLDDRYAADPPIDPSMEALAAEGVKIIAPPMWMLLTVEGGEIVPSAYAAAAKAAGLDIITWTIERSGRIVEEVLPTASGNPSFYYQSTIDVLQNDGDLMRTLDVLAREVGIIGIFSDWPATVTYYANCVGLK